MNIMEKYGKFFLIGIAFTAITLYVVPVEQLFATNDVEEITEEVEEISEEVEEEGNDDIGEEDIPEIVEEEDKPNTISDIIRMPSSEDNEEDDDNGEVKEKKDKKENEKKDKPPKPPKCKPKNDPYGCVVDLR
jgi:outer membrane biosynthesis protein TonB